METTEKTELICQDCKFPLARHAIYKDNLCPVVVIRSMPDAPAALLKLAHEACPHRMGFHANIHCEWNNGAACDWKGHVAIDLAVEGAKKVQIGLALEIAAADHSREVQEAVGKAVGRMHSAGCNCHEKDSSDSKYCYACQDYITPHPVVDPDCSAARTRAVKEAKSVIPAGPVLHIVHAALSKRDAEWREAAYAECFTPGHPTCAKFKDQHSVHKYGCGACRTVARMEGK